MDNEKGGFMAEKRYEFAFEFRFDDRVKHNFLHELFALNESKLKILGYKVERNLWGSNQKTPNLVATIEAGHFLPNISDCMRAGRQELLHFNCFSARVTMANTQLLVPDQKLEMSGHFKYRSGEWKVSSNGLTCEYSADSAARSLVITSPFTGYQPADIWISSFEAVLKSVHQSASLAKRLQEVVFTMQGSNPAPQIEAQERMIAAITLESK